MLIGAVTLNNAADYRTNGLSDSQANRLSG